MMDSRLRGNDGQDLCIAMLMGKPCPSRPLRSQGGVVGSAGAVA